MSEIRNGLVFPQNAIKSSAPKHGMGYFCTRAVQYKRKAHYVDSVLPSAQPSDIQKLEGNCLTGAMKASLALATPSTVIF